LKDKNAAPILDEDFSKIIQEYKTFQQTNEIETENSFLFPVAELNGRFDFDYYARTAKCVVFCRKIIKQYKKTQCAFCIVNNNISRIRTCHNTKKRNVHFVLWQEIERP
jgi:hypothetical protein